MFNPMEKLTWHIAVLALRPVVAAALGAAAAILGDAGLLDGQLVAAVQDALKP